MKKLFLICIMAIVCMTSIANTSNRYTSYYNVSDLNIIKENIMGVNYQSLCLKGSLPSSNSHSPNLPKVYHTYVIPIHTKNINLSDVRFDKEEIIDGIFNITPVIENKSINDLNDIKYLHYPEDTIVKPTVEIEHIENFKDLLRLVVVSESPFYYDASKGVVKMSKDISYSISYDEYTSPLMVKAHNDAIYRILNDDNNSDIDFIKSNVENPNDIDSFLYVDSLDISIIDPEIRQRSYSFTIITNSELAPAFERLVSLKRIQGINAGIVLIEDILNDVRFSAGDTVSNINDDAAKLRAYLMYHSSRIKDVLLGGKPPIIPIRYGYQSMGNTECSLIPTDSYFGTGSDVNWNYYNDGRYGQWYPGFSYSTMFNIGRLLCTSIEDVNNYIDKVEIYELKPGLGNLSYLNHSYTNFSNQLYSYLANSYFVNGVSGYNSICSSLDDTFTNPTVYIGENSISQNTGNNAINRINNGQWGLIQLIGHGNPISITTFDQTNNVDNGITGRTGESIYFQPENCNGLDSIQNFGYPNIMLTGSCTTTAFDSPRYQGYGFYKNDYDDFSMGFSQSFTNGKNYGGVGYIGNTRELFIRAISYFNPTFLNLLQDNSNKKLGALKNNTITSLLGNTQIAHIDRLGYNLIGDPTVEVWNTQGQIGVHTSPMILRNGRKIKVTTPVVGLLPNRADVILIEPDGFMYKSLNSTGYTFNNVNPYSTVYIKSKDYIPYLGEINIPKDITFNTNNRFFYGSNLSLGVNANGNGSPVTFSAGQYEYDIKYNVELGSNLIIPDSTEVTIYTKGVCHFDGLQINQGGVLKISAPEYIGVESISQEIADGRILFLEYDKYGVELMCIPITCSSKNTNSYIPLLVDGKEWRYTSILHHKLTIPGYNPELPVEKNVLFRINGTATINDKDYYVIHSYTDDSTTPDENCAMAYMREDTANGLVWCIPNPEYWQQNYNISVFWIEDIFNHSPQPMSINDIEEQCLYNFYSPTESAAVKYLDCYDPTETEGEYRMTFKWDPEDMFTIIPGIGLINEGELMLGSGNVNLFGYQHNTFASYPSSVSYLHLYEVIENGNTVYYDIECAPGCTSRIDAAVDADAIRYDGREISIRSAAKGVARIYNVQGAAVGEYTVNADTYIPTSALASGIYFVSYNGQTLKISVK